MVRSYSQVSASTSSREPVMFQYMPPGPSEESLRLNSGHHLPSRMGNGTPSSFMVLSSRIYFEIALFSAHILEDHVKYVGSGSSIFYTKREPSVQLL